MRGEPGGNSTGAVSKLCGNCIFCGIASVPHLRCALNREPAPTKMSTQPQSRIISLIEELNEIRRKGGADKFTLRRIKKDAGKLKSNPMEYRQAMGMIATVEGNPGEMRKHFKIAREFSPGNLDVGKNFASSLRNLGFYLEAKDIMNDLHDRLRGNSIFLESYIINFYVTGRFDSALQTIEEFNALQPDRPFSKEARIANFANFIESSDITEDEVEGYERVVEQFLQEKMIYGWLLEYDLVSDEESTILVGDVLLWNTIEETVILRMELGRRLAELQIPFNVCNTVHFHLKSRETLEDGDYADRATQVL